MPGPTPPRPSDARSAAPNDDPAARSPGRVLRLLDRFVPPSLRSGDPDLLRRARLLVAGSGVAAVVQALFAIAMLGWGVSVSAWVATVTALGIATLPYALRRGLPLRVASNLYVGLILVLVSTIGARTGGDPATSLFLASLIPSIAIMLDSRRSGLAWASIVAAWMLGLFAWQASGRGTAMPLDSELASVVRVGGALSLMTAAAGFSLCYEWLKSQALVELRAARRDAERSRDRALESEQRYRELVDHAPIGVLTLDPLGAVVRINPQARRMLGGGDDAPLATRGSPLASHLHELVMRLADGGSGAEVIRHVRPDGSTCDLRVQSTALRDARGRFRSTLVLLEDLTDEIELTREQSRLEAGMRNAQRLESLGLLAGGIAHDFNNLLTTILGNASLLRELAPTGDPAEEIADEILLASEHAADLTSQMLTYAGKAESRRQPVDVSALVDAMRGLLRSAIHVDVELVCDLGEALPPVLADVGQIRQVLLNLVTNASEAIRGRGRVAVRTYSDRAKPQHLTESWLQPADAPCVVLEVEDDGCGMDSRTRTRAFDPFFSTKAVGRGLGLSALLGIVRAHGGAAEVHTRPGTGTRVRILLPCTSLTVQTPAPACPPEEPLRAKARVLVVDDEPSVRSVAARVLEAMGVDVETAVDGDEALRLFEAEPGRYDLILLDYMMPGMRGDAVLTALRVTRPEQPVLLTSGYGAEVAAHSLEEDGHTGWLPKPYSGRALRTAVRKLIEI